MKNSPSKGSIRGLILALHYVFLKCKLTWGKLPDHCHERVNIITLSKKNDPEG